MECIGMDALPDGVVQHILSQVSSARDVAACAGVSRCWRDCVPYLPALYFPRGAFESSAGGSKAAAADEAIDRMVGAASRLEELVVYCPFSISLLPRWLAARGATLRVLELRVDSSADMQGQLDCVALALGLEELRLWGLSMSRSPAWGPLDRLRVLEVVGAVMLDTVVNGAVAACPNLTDLSLLGCECAGDVVLAPPLLERCRIDTVGAGGCSLKLVAPRVESLEVQGFGWISLRGGTGDRLKHLTISKNAGTHPIPLTCSPLQNRIRLPPQTYCLIVLGKKTHCPSQTIHGMFQGLCIMWRWGSSWSWSSSKCAVSSGAGEPSPRCYNAPVR
jgi:hypothetical protein